MENLRIVTHLILETAFSVRNSILFAIASLRNHNKTGIADSLKLLRAIMSPLFQNRKGGLHVPSQLSRTVIKKFYFHRRELSAHLRHNLSIAASIFETVFSILYDVTFYLLSSF